MPKISGQVATSEIPGGASKAVSPAVLQKRGAFDEIVRQLPEDFNNWTVIEPDEGENARGVMVGLARSAVRVNKEIMSRNDGSRVYVRLANPEEATAKAKTRSDLQKANAAAKEAAKATAKSK